MGGMSGHEECTSACPHDHPGEARCHCKCATCSTDGVDCRCGFCKLNRMTGYFDYEAAAEAASRG